MDPHIPVLVTVLSSPPHAPPGVPPASRNLSGGRKPSDIRFVGVLYIKYKAFQNSGVGEFLKYIQPLLHPQDSEVPSWVESKPQFVLCHPGLSRNPCHWVALEAFAKTAAEIAPSNSLTAGRAHHTPTPPLTPTGPGEGSPSEPSPRSCSGVSEAQQSLLLSNYENCLTDHISLLPLAARNLRANSEAQP